MYAFLKGSVDEIAADYITVDVHGVGYQVYCDLFTLAGMQSGKETKIYTSLQVGKDGAMTLYGFANKQTKAMFELLITVSGVGAKGAVKILSKLKSDEIAVAILTDNDVAFKGVASPKIASRILIDLKKKVGGDFETSEGISLPSGAVVGGGSVIKEATDALTGLGYTYSEAMNCVKAVVKEGMSVEDVIFLALRQGKQ